MRRTLFSLSAILISMLIYGSAAHAGVRPLSTGEAAASEHEVRSKRQRQDIKKQFEAERQRHSLEATRRAELESERRRAEETTRLKELARTITLEVRAKTRGFVEPLIPLEILKINQTTCEVAARPVSFAVSIGGLDVTPAWSRARFTANAAPNDVTLLTSTLESRGIDKTRLYALNGSRSTRPHIRAAFLDILRKLRCGDHVIVHFSGEGGSMLGLLSVVTSWDVGQSVREIVAAAASGSLATDDSKIIAETFSADDLGMVVEAEDRQTLDIITGRDVSNFLLAARNRGAFAIAAIDTGHAVKASLSARHLAAERASDWSFTFGGSLLEPKPDAMILQPDHGEFAIFYATSDDEGAPELRLPEGSDDAKPYGLFTFILAGALLESDDLTPRQFAELLAARLGKVSTSVHPRVEATQPDLGLIAEAQISRTDPIQIISPPSTRGAIVIKQATTRVEGLIDWPAKTLGIYVDNQPATVDASGRFAATVRLDAGVNKIGIVAVTADSRMHQKTVEVFFHGGEEALVGNGVSYALIIANQNYSAKSGMRSLQTPLRDAEALETILSRRFGFQTSIMTPNGKVSLILKDATKRQMETTLFQLGKVTTPRDRVLIFYAGHGVFEAVTSTAYWVPSDAEQGFEPSFLSASDISAAIQRIQAGSVILISDSCYSGALMRGDVSEQKHVDPEDRLNALLKLQSRRARVVITSGNNEPVIDNGGAGHSIFAGALLAGLKEIEPDAFSARELFDGFILQRVVANADQEPQFRPLEKVGHEGGDFVFVRRGPEQTAGSP